MLLQQLQVKNFRCIADATLEFDTVTPLIGPNGSGKSTFLEALRWFYEGPPEPSVYDFYGKRVADEPIEITATFESTEEDLDSAPEPVRLAAYVRNSRLQVQLLVEWSGDEHDGRAAHSFQGLRSQHAPFQRIRNQAGGAQAKTDALIELRDGSDGKYDDLKLAQKGWPQNDAAAQEWEHNHPTDCELLGDDGSFFEPPMKSGSPLHMLTELIRIPAQYDATTEAAASAGNLINQLVVGFVGDVSKSERAIEIQRTAEETFRQFLDEQEPARLADLGSRVTEILQRYDPTTRVGLRFEGGGVRVTSPVAAVQLQDRGFEGSVAGKGHGLQRLFVISLIEAAADLTAEQESVVNETQGPEVDLPAASARRHRVLTIEEPELYQHPLQARRFAEVLWRLAEPTGDRIGTQVAYSTHSPIFLPADKFAGFRLCYTAPGATPELPLITKVGHATVAEVVDRLRDAGAWDESYSEQRLQALLRSIMGPSVREGFFARTIVLVEGQEDIATIEGALRAADVDIEAEGIAVVEIGGKTNITRPAAVFDAFGIPIFIIFDGDADGETHADTNKEIQSFCGVSEPEAFPETQVNARFAVFHNTLTKDVREEFGNTEFLAIRDTVATDRGWAAPSSAQKNPVVIEAVLRELYRRDLDSPTLTAIAKRVQEMARHGSAAG